VVVHRVKLLHNQAFVRKVEVVCFVHKAEVVYFVRMVVAFEVRMVLVEHKVAVVRHIP